jgi:hypothetical protein
LATAISGKPAKEFVEAGREGQIMMGPKGSEVLATKEVRLSLN